MLYAFAFIEAVAFIFIGVLATLVTLVVALFGNFIGVAWRLWLWGSIACIIANVVVLAILSEFLVGIGIAGGPPPHIGLSSYLLSTLVLVSPLLASAVGVALGCWLGRRRNGREA